MAVCKVYPGLQISGHVHLPMQRPRPIPRYLVFLATFSRGTPWRRARWQRCKRAMPRLSFWKWWISSSLDSSHSDATSFTNSCLPWGWGIRQKGRCENLFTPQLPITFRKGGTPYVCLICLILCLWQTSLINHSTLTPATLRVQNPFVQAAKGSQMASVKPTSYSKLGGKWWLLNHPRSLTNSHASPSLLTPAQRGTQRRQGPGVAPPALPVLRKSQTLGARSGTQLAPEDSCHASFGNKTCRKGEGAVRV